MPRRTISLIVLILFALGVSPIAAANHQVSVSNFEFTPADLTIQVGDTVTWKNEAGLHNVRSDTFRCANGCDGDGMGGNGDPATNDWEVTLEFNDPDFIDYVCEVHEGIGMVGTISVMEAGAVALSLAGSCPGPMTLSISGGTPSGVAAIIFADATGTDPIPVGGCQGTETGLSNPAPLAPVSLDGSGNGELTPNVPAGACGKLLQVMDVASCAMSNVVTVQ